MATNGSDRPWPKKNLEQLTGIDAAIAEALIEGLTDEQIGKRVHLSRGGVRLRLQKLGDMAGGSKRVQIVAWLLGDSADPRSSD